jgi:uncharacterized protein YifE (UPF0438 family)
MSQPADHASYLARHDFVIPPGDFTPGEVETLTKYGRWLDALASGSLKPTTPTQEQFVRVARGESEPATDFERVWAKVMKERAVANEIVRKFQALGAARAHAASLEAEYLAARQLVLDTVREQLDTIDAEFAEQIQAATDASAAAENDVREFVLGLRRTVGVAGIKVAYHPGRVTWDDQKLLAYAELHPEMKECRKVGKPWVAVRFADGGTTAAHKKGTDSTNEAGEAPQADDTPPAA